MTLQNRIATDSGFSSLLDMMPNDVLMTQTIRSGQTTQGHDHGARLPTTCHLSAAGAGTLIIYNNVSMTDLMQYRNF